MPAYFVRQPNGLLARFSTIPDGFTHTNLSEEGAIEVCIEDGMTRDDAVTKVLRGVRDEPLGGSLRSEQLLSRWHESLNTILLIHGTKALAEFLAENADTYGEVQV